MRPETTLQQDQNQASQTQLEGPHEWQPLQIQHLNVTDESAGNQTGMQAADPQQIKNVFYLQHLTRNIPQQ